MKTDFSTPCHDFIFDRIDEVECILGLLANRRRLTILTHLLQEGELSVGELLRRIDLTQSALSQHLALLREHGVVETRREGTVIFYRLVDVRVSAILCSLPSLFSTDTKSLDIKDGVILFTAQRAMEEVY